MREWRGWGRLPGGEPAGVLALVDRDAGLPNCEGRVALPFGNGRSYGDTCRNSGGVLLDARRLDRWIGFDPATGVLRCESGVLLRDILELVVPRGWFLPVTPGTRDVTVGGAIANDVHGKNHHAAGSFGHYVRCFELVRTTGERMVCGPAQYPQWFAATVGGLGLTGVITWAELQLIRVANPYMSVQTERFSALGEFWDMNARFELTWPYTVAWIDCLAQGKARGRGVFMAARHAAAQARMPAWRERRRGVPIVPPVSLVNGVSLRAFNTAYWHKARDRRALMHHVPYFYPLDAIAHWNRIYGRAGFYQYQCVVPPSTMRDAIDVLLRRVARSGQGSFLAVLKTFGNRPSAGLLSFPRPGATLALDFPNRGSSTQRLFDDLDAVVREAGGALYPAKDARMPPRMFAAGYPEADRFEPFIDPGFGSDFWRRVRA